MNISFMSQKRQEGFKTGDKGTIPIKAIVEPIYFSGKQREPVLDLSPTQVSLIDQTMEGTIFGGEFLATKQEAQSTRASVPMLKDLPGNALSKLYNTKHRNVSSSLFKIEEQPSRLTNDQILILQRKLKARGVTMTVCNNDIPLPRKDQTETLHSEDQRLHSDDGLSLELLDTFVRNFFTKMDNSASFIDKLSRATMKNVDNVEERRTEAMDEVVQHNVQEKIIFVLDRARDNEVKVSNEINVATLTKLRNSLKIFVYSMTTECQYGLITMDSNSSTWLHDITNDVGSLIRTIHSIVECPTADTFDLNTVFDTILKNVEIGEPDLDSPPKSVIKVLLMYGRSLTIPVIKMTDAIRNLMNLPGFTFHVALLNDTIKNYEIVKCFSKLNERSCFVSQCNNSYELHTAMLKLFSHPVEHHSQETDNQMFNF